MFPYQPHLIPQDKTFIFQKLLRAYTTEILFSDHKGTVYSQINNIGKGNPLRQTFSNLVCPMSKTVFSKLQKPTIYVWYAYDLFIQSNSIYILKKS